MSTLLPAGVGIGWRPEIAGLIAALDRPAFCEVVAETLPMRRRTAAVPPLLGELRARGIPVVPHGVSLSLGGAEPVSAARVDRLAACAVALGAPLVSEHIAFVRAGGLEAGHLLPIPRTRDALEVLVANVHRAQDRLPVPLALEPIAALFEWPGAELTEAEFLAEVLERTGAWLLLDVANVYANALNAGRDPATELDRLPTERIAYCHVAGGSVRDGLYHDTHTDPVPPQVLDLVGRLAERGAAGSWLLERDGHYPPAGQLLDELDSIASAAGAARITGPSLAGQRG